MTKELDWKNLGFAYRTTDCHVVYRWCEGKWDGGQLQTDPHFNIHIAATALHYGQSAFEGLKAYRTKSGAIKIFRPGENALRIQTSARRVLMPEISDEMFINAVQRVVSENERFLPPYGTGGSLYIRPLLFGAGAEIGLGPAKEYAFIVLVTPVGDYYKDGVHAIDAIVADDYDRAAPRGVGHVKVAGNYAAGLLPGMAAKAKGFPITLYLDAREHKYIDEFGTSNFIAITKDGKYVTPKSSSILPSITNLSLMQLARDNGMVVEQRPIQFDELKDFVEVGACGTAVVISPIKRIFRGEHVIEIQKEQGFGPQLKKLHDTLRSIQTGDLADRHGWLVSL